MDLAQTATGALDALLADAVRKVRDKVVVEDRVVGRNFDREQRAVHGLAWLATYVEAVRQLAVYAERMTAKGAFGELEEHLVRIGIGECLSQIAGGIPMSQGEIVRPGDFGLSPSQVAARFDSTIETLIETGNTAERRARVIELMKSNHNATVGSAGLDDTLESIREEM
ncbi:MAG TPA: acyl-CoA dehydrogenase, partial [Pseudolabrys sp.]|nr:acyl-CoA dehydrogenase [Pseudolabrys sp.]